MDIDLSDQYAAVIRLRERIEAHAAEIARKDARIAELESIVAKLEAVIKRQRERIGEGFRGEVRQFSDSIKDMLT